MKNVSIKNLEESIKRVYSGDVEVCEGDVYFCGDLVQVENLEAYGLRLCDAEPQISGDELDAIIREMGPELTNPI